MAINYGSNTVTSSTFQGTDKIINGTVETLYFYGATDWGQSYAWYKDSNHTISANRLPNETDNVILLGYVSSDTSNAAKCANLVVGGFNIDTTICVGSTITRQGSLTSSSSTIYIANTTGLFEGMRVEGTGIPINTVIMSVSSSSISISTQNASINASSSLTFYGQAYFSGGSFGNTLNGDAYFSGSTNSGTINGDAYFSNSTNNGTINGDAVLFGGSSISGGSSSSPIVSGSLALNDSSHIGSADTYIGGNVTLNNTSYVSLNGQSISYVLYTNGNIIVNDTSNLGSAYATGNIVLNDTSLLIGPSYTTKDIIFNDSSYANGSITSSGDVTFNDNSHADYSITSSGDITFNGNSYISGNNTMTCANLIWNTSYNGGNYNTSSPIVGNAIFLSGYLSYGGSSLSSPVITGSLTLKNGSYVSATAYVAGDVTFNDNSHADYSITSSGDITFNDTGYISGNNTMTCANLIWNTSYNSGSYGTSSPIVGNAIFLTGSLGYGGTSLTSPAITGSLTLKNGSSVSATAYVAGDIVLYAGYLSTTYAGGDVTFNGNSSSGSITSSGDVTFNDNSYANSSITSYGDITFNGSSYINSSYTMTCANLIWNSSYNSGSYGTSSSIVGNAIFLTGSLGYGGTSLSSPAITGSLTLKNGSYVNTTAYVAGDIVLYAGYLSTTYAGGDVTFNGGSHADGSIASSGDITFNDTGHMTNPCTMTCANLIWNSSYNGGNYSSSSNIVGNAIFLTGSLGYGGTSLAYPAITGSLTLKNGSSVSVTAYVAGDIFLYDSSNLSTLVYPGGDVTFNDSSCINYGTLNSIKNVTFNDSSVIYSNSSFSFSNKSQLILNTTTSNAPSSVNITDGNNLLTIVVNKLTNNSIGWIFGNGNNSIQCNTLIFNDECYLKGANTYNISNLIFNDKSYIQDNTTNSSSVVAARATFNHNSYCEGSLDVDLAIFNDNSYIDTDGLIGGSYGTNNAIFNTNSYNNGTVDNDAIFNDYSVNDGQVENNAVFNGFSNNIGTIGNDAFFNDLSTNSTGGNVSYVGYYYGLNNSNGGSDDTAYYLINE